jgi:uncharacterized LabA/DUF88 family protein
MANPQKVNIYIDGFNFYYGLRATSWRKYYWLDIVKFFDQFMKENQTLNNVYYFSATPIPSTTSGQVKLRNQSLFFRANKLNNKFKVILGKYVRKTIRRGTQQIHTYEEKQTDVNIACEMIKNVAQKNCDISILVSGDSDLVPPIKAIRELDSSHIVIVYFPPNRHSNELERIAHNTKKLLRFESRFRKALLPEVVALNNTSTITKPTKWS